MTDTERLDWLESESQLGLVGFGFEVNGGCYLELCQIGGVPRAYRDYDNVREAIDAAMTPTQPIDTRGERDERYP